MKGTVILLNRFNAVLYCTVLTYAKLYRVATKIHYSRERKNNDGIEFVMSHSFVVTNRSQSFGFGFAVLYWYAVWPPKFVTLKAENRTTVLNSHGLTAKLWPWLYCRALTCSALCVRAKPVNPNWMMTTTFVTPNLIYKHKNSWKIILTAIFFASRQSIVFLPKGKYYANLYFNNLLSFTPLCQIKGDWFYVK